MKNNLEKIIYLINNTFHNGVSWHFLNKNFSFSIYLDLNKFKRPTFWNRLLDYFFIKTVLYLCRYHIKFEFNPSNRFGENKYFGREWRIFGKRWIFYQWSKLKIGELTSSIIWSHNITVALNSALLWFKLNCRSFVLSRLTVKLFSVKYWRSALTSKYFPQAL